MSLFFQIIHGNPVSSMDYKRGQVYHFTQVSRLVYRNKKFIDGKPVMAIIAVCSTLPAGGNGTEKDLTF